MVHVEHPLIAINGVMLTEPSPRLALNNRYADAVLRAGGVPVAIPPVGGPSDIARLLERVDGLLLGGGDDVDMERLGLGPNHPAVQLLPAAKQDFDVELVRAALASGKPVLGVCLGMQLLAVVDGGRMFQHLPDDRPGSQEHRDGAVHPVRVEAGSRLARILDVDALDVISRHHQGVASVGPGWRVSALDAEGLIEGIEKPRHPFAVGVQWHPEMSPEGSAHDRLFRALVGAAGVAASHALYPPAERGARA